jgi:hypothetical protein
MPRRPVTVTFRVTRTLTDDIKLVFTWEGGAYIDVALEGHTPSEVINVWDYGKGGTTIPFTKAAMRAHVNTWIFEYPKEALVHDVRENW